MSDLGLSGLASGVDTSAIVSKLMALDRQGSTRIQLRQSAVQAEQNGLKAVAAKLAAVRDAAVALRDAGTWSQTQSVESCDSARVAVAKIAGAGIGGHTIA